MQFVIDPSIAVKIDKMKARNRWRDPLITERQIDQTRLVLDDGKADNPEFSFLVIGDSGSGPHQGHNPQRQIAEMLLKERDDCRFVLHTGDVIYLVGSSEYYPQNFIEPYREFLVGGNAPERLNYKNLTFNFPFLPVPGNHDYYDVPLLLGLAAQTTLPVRYLFGSRFDFDIGWHGSEQGKAYARAFLDYLKIYDDGELGRHLDRHYTASGSDRRCLRYRPGQFTRLPNRYYTFRSGGIDFFGLDSNTFNGPTPLPQTGAGDAHRAKLEARRADIAQQRRQLMEQMAKAEKGEKGAGGEDLDDLRTKLEQLEEVQLDLDKQLTADESSVTDIEQLDWLRQRLIESWDEGVRGRVIFLHHPPYVTEATKWHQAQTIAVRRRLRRVLDAVADEVGRRAGNRPLVDLILTGHAHCLEHLRTGDTGHADSNLDVVICGGSGYSLRRQRQEGPDLMETLSGPEDGSNRLVASSKLFIGRSGSGAQKRRPYSFLRIDVEDGNPPRFIVRPFIAERFERKWHNQALEPFTV